MYCGTNKTALCSQKHIADALFSLMKTKPYPAISISELCKCSGVSRQTFYSLFRSKENVVAFMLQEYYCFEGNAACRMPKDPDEALSLLCRGYSGYICRHREFLRLLVDNNILYLLYDSIYSSFMHGCCCKGSGSDTQKSYTAHFLAGALTGVVKGYSEEPADTDPDSLYQLLLQLLAGRIFTAD